MKPSSPLPWFLAAALAWGWTWLHLSDEWLANPQYEYALGVPVLFAFMAWRRWQDNPREPARDSGAFWLMVVIGFALLLWGEVLRRQDPLWRMTGGMLAAGSTLFTMAFFWRAGGWALLRREWFPLAFAWLALPWPTGIEKPLVQFLLQSITGVAVWISYATGTAALQHGNVIELPNAWIGVEEACSGIQSLQATLMVSLFFGEYFALSPWRRAALVFGGWTSCLITNMARVLALMAVANSGGQPLVARWHDMIGGTVTTVNFAVLIALAFGLRPRLPNSGTTAQVPQKKSELLGAVRWEGLLVVALVLAVPFAGAAIVSRLAPSSVTASDPRWKLQADAWPAGWNVQALPEPASARAMLRFQRWEGYRLQTPEGVRMQIVHLRWDPRHSASRLFFPHTPDVCLPSSGWQQVGGADEVTLDAGAKAVTFSTYRFAQEGVEPIAVWLAFSGGAPETLDHLPRNSWERLLFLSTPRRTPSHWINEELLLYLPDRPQGELRELAAQLLKAARPVTRTP